MRRLELRVTAWLALAVCASAVCAGVVPACAITGDEWVRKLPDAAPGDVDIPARDAAVDAAEGLEDGPVDAAVDVDAATDAAMVRGGRASV